MERINGFAERVARCSHGGGIVGRHGRNFEWFYEKTLAAFIGNIGEVTEAGVFVAKRLVNDEVRKKGHNESTSANEKTNRGRLVFQWGGGSVSPHGRGKRRT